MAVEAISCLFLRLVARLSKGRDVLVMKRHEIIWHISFPYFSPQASQGRCHDRIWHTKQTKRNSNTIWRNLWTQSNYLNYYLNYLNYFELWWSIKLSLWRPRLCSASWSLVISLDLCSCNSNRCFACLAAHRGTHLNVILGVICFIGMSGPDEQIEIKYRNHMKSWYTE